MKTNLIVSVLAVAGLGLSGCGVSDIIDDLTDLDDENEITPPVAALLPTAQRIQNGEEITASHVAGLRLDYGADTAAAASGDGLRFQKTGDDTYTATLNGTTYTFDGGDRVTDSDGNIYTFTNDNPPGLYSSIWHQTGELDVLLAQGDEHVNVIGMQVFDETVDPNANTRIFAVVGAETPADQIPTNATAVYSGFADIQAFPKVGFDTVTNSRSRYRGSLEMTADFGAATVDGSVTNLSEQLPGSTDRTDIAGTVLLNETSISSGSFTGTVGVSGTAGLDSANAGTYSGGFFGPNAGEVGGVISMEGADAVANGFFIGASD